ncbi:MAG: ABC transporter ATP-binding protein [Desulfatiglans sp.]|jgi:tungstate transport system ATP-binding protein|nr:ABC transporter ATP-binding protein [Desulfatiglans sp.]
MLYRLGNLVKSYDGRKVLDIDRLSIEKGLIYGLIGPNGAGKTTLLEALAFLLMPDKGELFYNDIKVNNKKSLHPLRREVVLLQQQPVMLSISVKRNVEFPLKIRGVARDRRKAVADELLAMVGMSGFAEAPAHKLSGGETQRVAIARALACSPSVILLDEPTAGVDIENRVGIETIIRRINREKGISIIFTSHDMLQVARLADEIIYINNGRVSDSIHENIYSGIIKSNEKGKYVIIHDSLNIPIDFAREEGHCRVSINPLKIKIIRQMRVNSADGQIIKGRLMQLTSEGEMVRVLVDTGVPLSLIIDKNNESMSGLMVGETVFLECPKESIEFI